MQFTVFAKARPIRTAFLIRESDAFDLMLDGLASWSSKFWGGRQSAVVLLDNDNTPDIDAWQELARFDPDYIYSFAPLPDGLLAKLDDELLPWFIKAPKAVKEATTITVNTESWIEEHIEIPAISVPPSEQNLAALGKHPLLLFNFGKECPTILRRFVHRNFGTYEQQFDRRTGEPLPLGWLENLLVKIPALRIRVDNLASLCNAMERISGTPYGSGYKSALSCIAPCELSSAHLPRSFLHGSLDYTYRVVVGSDLKDFIFYWRNCLNEGDGVWGNPFRHCLWIPKELIYEPQFVAALRNWLYHFTNQGNSNNRSVEVVSVTLPSADLSRLLKNSRPDLYSFPMRFVAAADIEARWKKERIEREGRRLKTGLSGDNAQRLVAVERVQTRELQPPPVIQPESPVGTWAVDVQIERDKDEHGFQNGWWDIPRRSGRGLAVSIFRCSHARISCSGLFAVRVEQNSIWQGIQTPARLQLQLPYENEVLRNLLIQRLFWFDHDDARRERIQIKSAVANMEISDAGRKLRGLIELFGGFQRARDYWERTFWREIFYQMAGRGAHYDTDFRIQAEAVIKKEINKRMPLVADYERQKAAQKICQRILGLVGERLPGTPLSFAEMEEDCAWRQTLHGYEKQVGLVKDHQHLAGDTLVHTAGVKPVTKDELKEGLDELVHLGVFHMGKNIRCPRCRLQHWINVATLRQSDSCPGCGSRMILLPETLWSYRLNPLIHHCVNHNVLAVWQALQEASHWGGSFFFEPSSELHFTKPINGRNGPKEVDVLCVREGKLLIGEVKTGALAEKYFEEFAAIAAAIRPEHAAMFVESEFYDDKASRWFEKLRQQLKPLGIQGKLFELTNY